MSDFFGFVINTIRLFLSDLEVVNDKKKQTITFKRKAEERVLTYAELAEQIERAFDGQ